MMNNRRTHAHIKGAVVSFNDPITEGPMVTSKVVGNAQGLYVSAGSETISLVVYVDIGFTTGKFNGSSISVFSRYAVMDEGDQDMAVVGGRGKFRMARGFARVKTTFFNATYGVFEYHVTLFHYKDEPLK